MMNRNIASVLTTCARDTITVRPDAPHTICCERKFTDHLKCSLVRLEHDRNLFFAERITHFCVHDRGPIHGSICHINAETAAQFVRCELICKMRWGTAQRIVGVHARAHSRRSAHAAVTSLGTVNGMWAYCATWAGQNSLYRVPLICGQPDQADRMP